jgi:ribose transport system permease protein
MGTSVATLHRLRRALARVEERGVLLALAIVFIAATFSSPYFLRVDNLAGILQDITFLGLIAVGVSFALIAGEIDISVGSTYGLVSVITAVAIHDGLGVLPSVLLGLAGGFGAGLVNGVATVALRVPAVIVTLAALGIYRGFALVLANGAPVSGLPEGGFFFGSLGTGRVWGQVTWLATIFLGVAAIASLVLSRTSFGFRVYAVGSNPQAARLVGMGVARMRITVLAISGLTAGLAGVLSVGYLSSANPTGGTGYELDALAAVIIGGSKLSGGRGTIAGTVIGLFIVGIIRNILVLAGVSVNWQTAVSGAVLASAVALDRISRRDSSS